MGEQGEAAAAAAAAAPNTSKGRKKHQYPRESDNATQRELQRELNEGEMKMGRRTTACYAIVLAVAVLAAAGAADAQKNGLKGQMKRSTIEVTGNAAVTIPPEYVSVTVGVETKNESASAALQENNQLTTDVSAAIEGLGIESDDVVTQSIRLSPNYFYNDTSQQSEVSGFTASNTLTVNIRPRDDADLDELTGQVLTTLVEEGINNINGVNFLAGYKIGGVLSMNVNDFNSPSPVSYEDAALGAPRMASAPIATPVSSGTISVSSAVDIVYFLVKEDAEN